MAWAAERAAGSPLATSPAQPLTSSQCRVPPPGRTFSLPAGLEYLTATTPSDAVPLVPFITAVQLGPAKASRRWLIVPKLTPVLAS
jgi:hypothetical protein